MTAKEYLKQHSKIINNHLIIGPLDKDSPYCAQCFEQNGEVVNAPFDRTQNSWVCPKGHIGRNEPLASSGVVHGPQ